MHRAIPPGAHDLRDAARIVATGLVRHRAHRRLGLAGLAAEFAAIPASVSPRCSHAVSEHASRPTRRITSPLALKNATSASGSLAARASRTIRPASSTMQIAVSSSDTSNPAK
jgi:hypothetical protein